MMAGFDLARRPGGPQQETKPWQHKLKKPPSKCSLNPKLAQASRTSAPIAEPTKDPVVAKREAKRVVRGSEIHGVERAGAMPLRKAGARVARIV
jgi:hypothetical protein